MRTKVGERRSGGAPRFGLRALRAPLPERQKPRIAGLLSVPGEGLETPDTRIMIPAAFPVFTGDPGSVGLQVGLFCQTTGASTPIPWC